MSKYIKPWRPLLFCSAQPTAFTARMPSDHMDTAQPSELACLPQEPRVTMRHKISYSYKTMFANCRIPNGHWKTLMPCCSKQNSLQAVINEQDCRAIRTACCCLKSLRIRVEARANVTERAVISRQLQLMQASIQHYPTEDLNTAGTSCPSRTSAEHFDTRPGPCPENERSHPCTNVAEPATMVNRPHRIQLAATHAFVDQ